MAEFESCDKCKFSSKAPTEEPCNNCIHNAMDNFKPKSNADRIRNMSDVQMSRELIDIIMEVCEDGVPCEEYFLEWLKSEVEDGR